MTITGVLFLTAVFGGILWLTLDVIPDWLVRWSERRDAHDSYERMAEAIKAQMRRKRAERGQRIGPKA